MMRRSFVLAALLGTGAVTLEAQQPRPTAPVTVALYPLTVPDTTQLALRALGDSCVTLMARKLSAESVVVQRRPPAMAQLRRAQTAQYAITGTLKPDSGRYNTELKLWDVPLNEELRSYFSGPDSLACRVPEAAAIRIGAVIRQIERGKQARRRP
jgi:hypothetical protein